MLNKKNDPDMSRVPLWKKMNLTVEEAAEYSGMRYRIEYADGRCCNFANSRKDLLDWLKLLKDEQIVDIRKIYKSGVTDLVLDSYRRYLK